MNALRVPFAALFASLLMLPTALADEEGDTAALDAPFTMTASFEGETLDTSAGTKLTAFVKKAALKTRRLPPGEPTGFDATATINGSNYTFDNPTAASALLTAVKQVELGLKKSKMTFEDLGSFDNLPAPPPEGAKPKLSPAQVQALIQQRAAQIYQQKMLQSMRGGAGRGGRPGQGNRGGRPGGGMPNPQSIAQWQQQAYQQAVKEAQQAGVLPEGGAAPMQPAVPVDPKEAKIEAFRNVLIPILQQGVPEAGFAAAEEE